VYFDGVKRGSHPQIPIKGASRRQLTLLVFRDNFVCPGVKASIKFQCEYYIKYPDFKFYLFVFICNVGIWTQVGDLPLEPTTSPFCFDYSWGRSHIYALVGLDMILLFTFLWSLDDRCVPPSPALYWLRWESHQHLLGLIQTAILQISASKIAKIIGLSFQLLLSSY
jgi:hypothetical protein